MRELDGHLIGSAEAAQILGVTRQTLTRWLNEGRLKPVHRFPSAGKNGALVYVRADIEQLHESLTTKKEAAS